MSSGGYTNHPAPMSRTSLPPPRVVYLPTTEAYNRWAQVYDTDSNPLQALDDRELVSLLPDFLRLVRLAAGDEKLRLVDLGCGTGRNTIKLLPVEDAEVIGLDGSYKMLDIARARCTRALSVLPSGHRASEVSFHVFDMLGHEPLPPVAEGANAVISTLVLEHVPLETFFTVCASMLSSGGFLLVTNMHPEMGSRSQAGFVDTETGEKIRPVSYAHLIEDVRHVARLYGFEMVGPVRESAVVEDNVEYLGRRASKWLGTKCWMSMIFEKRAR